MIDNQNYTLLLQKVETLMNKGSQNLTKQEKKELSAMASEIEAFEKFHFPLPKPRSIQTMLELKMYELRLKQKDLAKILDEPESRISEIMNGKRGLNLQLAQKLYKKLNIPADFILENG